MVDRPDDHSEPSVAGEGLEEQLTQFEFRCPQCARMLERYSERCPLCDADLASAYAASFAPPKSRLAKTVAWITLIAFIGSMLVLVWSILRPAR